jgi:hypothetical protein
LHLKNAELLMQICSLRDFYYRGNLSLAERVLYGKYLTILAAYAARQGDNARFEFYKKASLHAAGDFSNVYKSLAYIYYSTYRDGWACMANLEKSMELNPYDFSVVNLIISIYDEQKMYDKELAWLLYYRDREWHKGKKAELDARIRALGGVIAQ